jgi:hypothetical protein
MGMKHIVNIDTTETILFDLGTQLSKSDLLAVKGFEFTEKRGEIISYYSEINNLLDLIFDILSDANHLSMVTLSIASEDFSVDYPTRVGYGRVRGVEEPIVDPARCVTEVHAFAVSPGRRSIILIGKEPNYAHKEEVPF